MLNNNKIKIAIIFSMIVLTIIIIVIFILPKILHSTKNQPQITNNLSTRNKPIVGNPDQANQLNNSDSNGSKNNTKQNVQNPLISSTKTNQQQSGQQTNNADIPNLSKNYTPRYRPVTIFPTNTDDGNDPKLFADLLGLLFNFDLSSGTNNQNTTTQNTLKNTTINPTITPIPTNAKLNKIGIYLMSDYSPGGQLIINAKPQVIKVMDPQKNNLLDAVKEYKKVFPKGIVVLRFYEATRDLKYLISDDPTTSAQDFHQKVIALGLAALGENKRLIDYIETPNELDSTPGWESSESITWLAKFWEELISLNNKAGIKTCVASIPVGNPPGSYYEIKGKLQDFLPALIKTKQNNGAVCYHAYTLDYTQNVNTETYSSLRYRLIHQAISEIDSNLSNLPFILSEAGVDQSGNPQESGWQAHGGAQQYMNWIGWFDREISQDNYVIGATLYQIGDNYWSSFNLEPIAGWIAGKLN